MLNSIKRFLTNFLIITYKIGYNALGVESTSELGLRYSEGLFILRIRRKQLSTIAQDPLIYKLGNQCYHTA